MTTVPGLGVIAPTWEVATGRRVLLSVQRAPEPNDVVVTAFRDGVVTRRANRRMDGFTESVKEIGYQHVDTGDLVVHSMDGFAGAIGVADSSGKMSPVANIYAVDGDARYVAYVLRSLAKSGFIQALAKGIRERSTSFDRVTAAELDLPRPPVGEQQRIADFLDDRVARIDRIIAARREQALLNEQVRWRTFAEVVKEFPDVPLRRAIQTLADGPFGSAFSSSDYADSGPAVIRLGNIGFADFRRKDLSRIPEDIYDRFPNARVQVGDLLIASLGDARNHAGRACLAPADLGPAMVKGKCFVGRAVPAVASERFLAVLLSSQVGANSLVRHGTGATRSMLNFERLLSCRLPIPSIAHQSEALDAFDRSSEESGRLGGGLRRSINLLAEYKSSLITAAVTGELDVTTAGSGIPA